MGWRTRPRLTTVLGGSLWFLVALAPSDLWFPDSALAILAGLAAAAALAWTGRAGRGRPGRLPLRFLARSASHEPGRRRDVQRARLPGRDHPAAARRSRGRT